MVVAEAHAAPNERLVNFESMIPDLLMPHFAAGSHKMPGNHQCVDFNLWYSNFS